MPTGSRGGVRVSATDGAGGAGASARAAANANNPEDFDMAPLPSVLTLGLYPRRQRPRQRSREPGTPDRREPAAKNRPGGVVGAGSGVAGVLLGDDGQFRELGGRH